MAERYFEESAAELASRPAPATNGNDHPVIEGDWDEDTLASLDQ